MNQSEPLKEQSHGSRQELQKAGYLARTVARTIDFAIVTALYEIIPAIGYFAGLTYLLLCDGLFEGKSIGKSLTGLKVVDRDNRENCGYKESAFRNFPFAVAFIIFGIFKAIPLLGWLISFAVIVGILIFESLVIIGSENGMRLGDELANTWVVEDKQGGFNVS
jgi:uncharacterized RDD family membrane protein YckC